MNRAPGAIDFAAAWRAWLEGAADPRLDPALDLAYWERHAADADRWASQRAGATLAAIAALIGSDDTILDVGAGTGRFALPLASQCRSVTLLDQSPAVLAIARGKAATLGLENLRFVAADWATAPFERHDVVLVAWSLYRELDLRTLLARLVAAADRLLIMLAPDADASQEARGETAGYLYVLGALRELGVCADLTIVDEPQPDGAPIPVPLITWRRPEGARDA
jgi:SAM-dependent methyltransferase